METFGLKYFLSVIAMVFIVEGIPYFLSPGGIKKWVAVLQDLPESYIRLIGLVFMITGVAILFAALRVIS